MRTACTILTLLAITFTTMAMHPPDAGPQIDPPALKAFATQTNQFGYDLYSQLCRTTGNLFISPYSISTALAMTTTGARGNTADEMTKVLYLSTKSGDFANMHAALLGSLLTKPKGYDFRIANAIWGQNQHPFKSDFINLVQRSFRAEGRTLDFKSNPEVSRQTINRWVEQQTNDRIKDLLPQGSLTPDSRMVLTNAIYFKGKWATPFNKSNTQPHEFNMPGQASIKTDMMSREGEMWHAQTDDMQVLELPYEGNRLSMVILLPKKVDGLADVEASLSSEKVAGWLHQLKLVKVNLTLPKIKTTCSKQLKSPLIAMGMKDAFDGRADFSGMDGTRELCIADVYHKAFCEVNEEGTEAAAATGAVMKLAAAPITDKPIEFTADHPYLYLIRDKQTGSLLFLGRVADPRN